MNALNLNELLEPVVALARSAGEKIMEIYATEFSVETKDDNSPLTMADLASHQEIARGLTKIGSAFPLISEESTQLPYSQRQRWDTYWLIDPLDGTKEFVKRNGQFTVNIALIHQHEPVLGVVDVPALKQRYFAARGAGSFMQDRDGPSKQIFVRENAPAKLTVAGSLSHKTQELESYLGRLGDYDLISMGSSLKLCLVAEGKADIYPRIGLTSEWDTAAAQCVVEQAGGRVTDLKGNLLRYNTKESFLNPYFLVFGDTSRDWTQYANDI
ncbi:MAG: 3'(2'),5'-bisphosphate nucleotidase CysQ [Methylococcales bacterium]